MAFTLLQSPPVLAPIYNKLAFAAVETTMSTNDKYIIWLYINSLSAPVEVIISSLYPRANAIGSYPAKHMYIDVAPILKNYIDGSIYLPGNFQRTSTLSGGQEVLEYYVKIYKQSSLLYTSSAFYTWVGCPEYKETIGSTQLNNYITGFVPSQTKPSNVLNFKNYNRYVTLNDYVNVSLFPGVPPNYNTFGVGNIVVQSNTGKSWLRTYDYKAEKFLQVGVGPKNINESTVWTAISPTGAKLNETDTSYTVKFLDFSTTYQLFKTLTFNITSFCKYKRYRVDYQAQDGGYGYVNFALKSQKEIKSKKDTYNKYLNYYSTTPQYDRNIIVYDNRVEGSYTLNTDWLEQEDIMEVEELILSPSLFLVDEDNNTIPVYIDSINKIISDKSQDKMVQYEIEFKEAFNRNIIL